MNELEKERFLRLSIVAISCTIIGVFWEYINVLEINNAEWKYGELLFDLITIYFVYKMFKILKV